MAADVVVRFLADTSDMSRGVSSIGKTLKGFARGAAGLLGGAALLGFAKDAITMANSTDEALNKVKVVFGDAAGEIRRFTRTSAESLGIARLDALSAAGAYGNMFTQLGLTTREATSMSKGLLTLTADLASFHDADPTAMLQALSAAFRGEYDSIQAVIPTINAAAVEQRALADTGKTSADQLTNNEKALATYALLVEGAGSATGDFATTSDSAANQQKILDAKIKNTSGSIGKALQPVMATVVPLVADLAEAFAKLPGPIKEATIAFVPFVAIAVVVGGIPGLIIAGIGLLIVAIGLLWTQWDTVWNWIKSHPAIAFIIALLLGPMLVTIIAVVGALKFLQENWGAIWDWIKTAFADTVAWLSEAVDDVGRFFRELPGKIGAALSRVGEIIVAPFEWAWEQISGIADDIGNAFDKAVGFVKRIWNSFAHVWNGIEIKIPSVHIPLVGDIGGGSVGLPNLPILDSGGIVTKPTLALLAANSRPEAVVPLDRMGQTNIYQITIQVPPTASAYDVGRATVDAVRAYERVSGTSWRAS